MNSKRDKGQEDFLINKKEVLFNNSNEETLSYYKSLYSILEKSGKDLLVVPQEESINDLKQLVNKGVFLSETYYLIKGTPSNCHQNSVDYYLEHIGEGYNIYTGYALSDDGLWRQHSWIVDLEGFTYETTVERLSYYGFKLTGDYLKKFISNYL